MAETPDFFRNRLDQMIDLRHPLAQLASRMSWQDLEAAIVQQFARQVRAGKKVKEVDLFGPVTQVVGGGASRAGRPRLPFRLMISLLYLKHAYDESDEGVVARWGETPTWQYFSGMDYFEHRLPCDASQIGRFRKALGEAGVEELLAQTVNAAWQLKLIAPQHLQEILVDSTVQAKAIAYPTDTRLLEVARQKLVSLARWLNLPLKQTYAKEAGQLTHRASGYARARQFKRLLRVQRRYRTILGRVMRDLRRQSLFHPLDKAARQSVRETLAKAQRLLEQTATRQASREKLYSWHAPEVSCIGKGKARQPYEFGVKVGIATTLQGNLIVGARAFPGNPYDGHTLAEQLQQAGILLQDIRHQGQAIGPHTVYTDLGYRGVEAEVPAVKVCHRGKKKRLNAWQLKHLPRRQAIEPVIGHLKADHGLGRCWLKGSLGDRLHAVLCAAGYNLRWLLRRIGQPPPPVPA
ncbi:MAG: IS5 family transposase [Pigmentiphaga sp.]|nr:IS5 family transposase [Pigmentiphaga sp.]